MEHRTEDWQRFKSSAKQRWGKLTDADIDPAQTNEELLIGRLRELYGMSSEEARQQLQTMRESLREAVRGGEMYGGAQGRN